jgi:hypothetical protein
MMEIVAQRKTDITEHGRNGLIERTEIDCHECGETIFADIDLGLNGNHVIVCPCGHEHCRVVKNGRITSTRWDSRNSQVSWITATTSIPGTILTTSVSGSSSTINYCYAPA